VQARSIASTPKTSTRSFLELQGMILTSRPEALTLYAVHPSERSSLQVSPVGTGQGMGAINSGVCAGYVASTGEPATSLIAHGL